MALAALVGALAAVQSRINGELGHRLGDGVAAATISFGVGLALLAVVVPLTPAARRGLVAIPAALRRGELRPWQLLGGLCGAFLVATQGLTVALLGTAIFTVAVICGQMVSSLLVDRFGMGPSGAHPVTVARAVGAAIALVAAVVAVADRLGDPGVLGWAVLPAIAGLGIAWQQAVNGRVREAAGSALPATFVNFAVGAVGLVVVLLVHGLPHRSLPGEWWLYLGGPMGIAYIAIAASVVRVTGVLLLGLATVAGQLAAALVLDAAFPVPGHRLSAVTVAGAVLAVVAVVVASRPAKGNR